MLYSLKWLANILFQVTKDLNLHKAGKPRKKALCPNSHFGTNSPTNFHPTSHCESESTKWMYHTRYGSFSYSLHQIVRMQKGRCAMGLKKKKKKWTREAKNKTDNKSKEAHGVAGHSNQWQRHIAEHFHPVPWWGKGMGSNAEGKIQGYLGGKEIQRVGRGETKQQRKPVCPLIWKTGKMLIIIL